MRTKRYTLEGENRHIILDFVIVTKGKNLLHYFKIVYQQEVKFCNKRLYTLEKVRDLRDTMEAQVKASASRRSSFMRPRIFRSSSLPSA